MRQEDRAVGPTEALGEVRANDVLELVRTFERLPDNRRLTGALAATGASR